MLMAAVTIQSDFGAHEAILNGFKYKDLPCRDWTITSHINQVWG